MSRCSDHTPCYKTNACGAHSDPPSSTDHIFTHPRPNGPYSSFSASSGSGESSFCVSSSFPPLPSPSFPYSLLIPLVPLPSPSSFVLLPLPSPHVPQRCFFAMTLKTWQISLVFAIQAAIASLCVGLLATRNNGRDALNAHRTFQLIFTSTSLKCVR